jgi:hypothetical protein
MDDARSGGRDAPCLRRKRSIFLIIFTKFVPLRPTTQKDWKEIRNSHANSTMWTGGPVPSQAFLHRPVVSGGRKLEGKGSVFFLIFFLGRRWFMSSMYQPKRSLSKLPRLAEPGLRHSSHVGLCCQDMLLNFLIVSLPAPCNGSRLELLVCAKGDLSHWFVQNLPQELLVERSPIYP